MREKKFRATIAAPGMRFMTEMFFRDVEALTLEDARKAIEGKLKGEQYIYHIGCQN